MHPPTGRSWNPFRQVLPLPRVKGRIHVHQVALIHINHLRHWIYSSGCSLCCCAAHDSDIDHLEDALGKMPFTAAVFLRRLSALSWRCGASKTLQLVPPINITSQQTANIGKHSKQFETNEKAFQLLYVSLHSAIVLWYEIIIDYILQQFYSKMLLLRITVCHSAFRDSDDMQLWASNTECSQHLYEYRPFLAGHKSFRLKCLDFESGELTTGSRPT